MKWYMSPITPLAFYPAENDPTAHVLRFTQRFGRYDHIVVQAMADEQRNPSVWVYNAINGSFVLTQYGTRVSLGGGRWMYTIILPVMNEGVYYAILSAGGKNLRSQDFEITRLVENDPDWALIEYSNSTNDTPMNAMFIVNGIRVVFKLRLPAGFKPQGYTPNVAQETWRTQRQELRQLYSAPYDKWALTLGTAQGIPVEYIRMFNAILSCDMVYINGQRWCRSEGSVPEKQLTMQGSQMFTATVDMERQLTIEDYPQELYAGSGDYNGDYNNDYDK